jgi:hypothetical protein
MSVSDYGIYTIQCRLGSETPVDHGYLHVRGATRQPGSYGGRNYLGYIMQWSLAGRGVPFTDHFEFMFIADGQSRDTYYIVNRRSGLCLRLPSTAEDTCLIQDDYRPELDKEFRFVLEPVTPDADCSSYRLVSAASGHLLMVHEAKPTDGQSIRAYAEATIPLDRKAHIFELVEVATGVGPPQDEPQKVPTGRDLPKLGDLDTYLPDTLPEREDAVVLERAFVPFFAVNDPALARYRQVEVSPYYTINRWQRWRKVHDRLLDGQTKRTTTEFTTVGMTQTDASTVRSTFNWSVDATVEASYRGVAWGGSAKLSSKIGGEVEKTSQHSTESRVDRSITEEITYPDLGRPYRIVTWVPVDVFDLCTSDGRIVHSWSATREQEMAVDCFPPQATAQPTKPENRGTGVTRRGPRRRVAAR